VDLQVFYREQNVIVFSHICNSSATKGLSKLNIEN
jgi:hypothetical protein